jgi:hypothetical protein
VCFMERSMPQVWRCRMKFLCVVCFQGIARKMWGMEAGFGCFGIRVLRLPFPFTAGGGREERKKLKIPNAVKSKRE